MRQAQVVPVPTAAFVRRRIALVLLQLGQELFDRRQHLGHDDVAWRTRDCQENICEFQRREGQAPALVLELPRLSRDKFLRS